MIIIAYAQEVSSKPLLKYSPDFTTNTLKLSELIFVKRICRGEVIYVWLGVIMSRLLFPTILKRFSPQTKGQSIVQFVNFGSFSGQNEQVSFWY